MQIYITKEREKKLRDYCEFKGLSISGVLGSLVDTLYTPSLEEVKEASRVLSKDSFCKH